MIVDFHVHPVASSQVLDPRKLRFLEERAVCLVAGDVVGTLLSRMDAAGIGTP
jgi:hypothetical protein